MKRVSRRQSRRNSNFDINPIRRAEIIRHAVDVGAMDTDDRERWLVAYAVHNPEERDQVWGVIRAARKMGGEITRAEAIAIVDLANEIEHGWGADGLARYLGLNYDRRQRLGITAIGITDIDRAGRQEIRRV